MRIRVNGEDRDVAEGSTVASLLVELGLGGRRVAVERNRDVVPAPAWDAERLAEGDELEVVHFVGGG